MKRLLLLFSTILFTLTGCENNKRVTLREQITTTFYNDVYLIYCKNNDVIPLEMEDEQFTISEVRMNYQNAYIVRFSLKNETEQKIIRNYDGYDWVDYTGINQFYVWYKYNVFSIEYAYQNKYLKSDYFYMNEVIQNMIDDTSEEYKDSFIEQVYKNVWDSLEFLWI